MSDYEFFNILGPSDYTVAKTNSPEMFKYAITTHNEDTGEEHVYLSRGERSGAAAASAKFGLYAFSSYHSGGYLNPIPHDQIAENGWDATEVISLWYVIRRGQTIQIAVTRNEYYRGLYYQA